MITSQGPNRRIVVARRRALEDAAALVLRPPGTAVRQIKVAIGDPQAPLDTFLQILETNGLLGDDGRLRPEVSLASMGDHFDWGKPADRRQATEEGTALLCWLAAHPPDQVQIVFGNHDLVRVGELSGFTNETFAAARAEADLAYADPSLQPAFLVKHPMVASAEVLARDFACFDVKQRELVTRLLKTRRARLAVAAAPDLLLVHAGLTVEELKFLEVMNRDAVEIAAALNRFLDERVAGWTTADPLDLSPLHEGGSAKEGEARGILFHRPANPAIKRLDRASRRFDPRTLPRWVSQAIGHINDQKCRELLGDWADPAAPVFGPIRGLRLGDTSVSYRVGCEPRDALIFLDGGMNHVAPAAYQLLDLKTRQPFARAQ